MADQFRTSAPIQVSHMHITDRATEAAVRTLSRYEIAGLRRRAEYGDVSAAFQLGMAYEIGRGVSQQCTSAAQWVARAAGEGNAAAQFNLGLRYRDGDGVPADEDEAKVAAAGCSPAKYRRAGGAYRASGECRSLFADVALTKPTTKSLPWYCLCCCVSGLNSIVVRGTY